MNSQIMVKTNIIKLKNLTPLHVGTGKEQYDFSATDVQSDTLSAALASLRAQQGKTDVEEFLNSFALSSAFPFWDTICFLPKLKGKIKVKMDGKKEEEYRKQLKKLKYIDSSLWSTLVKGEELPVKETQLQDDFLIRESNISFVNPYKSQVNQRVSVPRADNENAAPFYFNWTFFQKDAGLYCLTDAQGEKYQELVALFKLLGENGLGTDRNVGGGKFEVDTGTLDLPEIADANYTLLLSLFIPTKEELPKLKLQSASYELLLRGGFMAGSSVEGFRHLRKRSVYMFSVGSLFPTTEKLTGKTVNLAPDWNDERMHPVFRSGRPFQLRIKN
jgi:CRISPR type III-A-associated RAMP protein Csm4